MQRAVRAAYTNISLALAVSAGLLAVILWTEYSSWRSAVTGAEQHLRQVAAAVSQHVDDSLDVAELALTDLITEIRDESGHEELPEKLSSVMKAQVAITNRLSALSYIDETGKVIAGSSDRDSSSFNFSDRLYFRFHQSSDYTGIRIGAPIVSRLGEGWIIPITRRYEHADGSFGGVVIATFPVTYFTRFFEKFETGSFGTFLLTRPDGLVLARAPLVEEMLGTDISTHELFSEHLNRAKKGIYHYASPVTGYDMIGAFVRSAGRDIVVLISVSRAETLTAWGRAASIRWTSLGLVLVLAGFASWRWHLQSVRRRASERKLRAREAEFRLLAESSADLIQRLTGDGIREYVSPASASIFGIPAEELRGRNIMDGLDDESATRVKWALEKLKAGLSSSEKVFARRDLANGRTIWVETTFSRAVSSDDSGDVPIVSVTRDVTRNKQMQDELVAAAHTDPLTGVANRRALDERMDELLRAKGQQGPVSLLMLDVDRFKLFNDTYGHGEGDKCLQIVAQTISESVSRAGDLAARFGGEEFAIVLNNTDTAGALAVAETILERVLDLGIPHNRNLPLEKVSVSIGIATAAEPASSAQELFRLADAALYSAKNNGRNRVEISLPGEAESFDRKLKEIRGGAA